MNQVAQILNAAIEQEMKTTQSICSWCNPGGGDSKTSHGLCTRHAQMMIDEILADNAKRAQIAAVTESVKKCGCPYHRGGNQFGCSRNADQNDWQAVRGF